MSATIRSWPSIVKRTRYFPILDDLFSLASSGYESRESKGFSAIAFNFALMRSLVGLSRACRYFSGVFVSLTLSGTRVNC